MEACHARATGAPERFPHRDAKPDRPQRHGVAYVLTSGDRVALVRRPAKGLLGGMLALPTSEWRATPFTDREALATAPIAADWKPAGEIDHGFTHFTLTLQLLRAEGAWSDANWTPRSGIEAMPSVFLKAARAALGLGVRR
jgi:A/G-specific adenine glycosylase